MNIEWDFCRFCLLTKKRMQSTAKALLEENNSSFLKWVSEFVGITDVNYSSEQLICSDCRDFLHSAYRFQNTCKKTNKFLRFLSKRENDVTSILKYKKSCIIISHEDIQLKATISERNSVCITSERLIPIKKKENISLEKSQEQDDGIFTTDFENETGTEIDNACSLGNEVDNNLNSDQSEEINKKRITRKKQNRIGKKTERNKEGKSTINNKNRISPRTKLLNTSNRKNETESSNKLESAHICEICGNLYGKKHALESHMKWHKNEKSFTCEICGKGFNASFQVTRHMRVHTGQKPYECTNCGRKFSDLSSCTRHKRTHTNERPYECKECGKSFNYSDVLKAHILTHTGEKPFSCEPCGKTFTRKHHLTQHLGTIVHQTTAEKYILSTGICESSGESGK